MDKIIKDIEIKVRYYELFIKVKYAGMGERWETIKNFIQDKVTQHPDITLNDFEFEIFQKIGELYHEMNSGSDSEGDY